MAKKLSKFLANRKDQSKPVVRNFWEKNFSATNNYKDFCKRIIESYAI